MCVLYVSFGSNVGPRTFGYFAMGSAVLFILRYRCLLHSAGSGVNRVQVVLSCPDKNFRYVWLYVFLGCTVVVVCHDQVRRQGSCWRGS